MRFEVLHGNIDKVFRDLVVENEEAPYRLRQYLGDVFERIGCTAKQGTLCVYTKEIAGQYFLIQMFCGLQNEKKAPTQYFHAFATEVEPQDYAKDFSEWLTIGFASESDLVEASKGQPYHNIKTESVLQKLDIPTDVIRQILNACINRWAINQLPVIILVPQEADFHAYAKAVMKEIYSYFPAGLRAISGFVSSPKEEYEAIQGVSIIFLPDNDENASKQNAMRINEGSGYFSSLLIPELLPLVECLVSANSEERSVVLQELFEKLEGNGDEEIFHKLSARSYIGYFQADINWEELSDDNFVIQLSSLIRKSETEKQKLSTDLYHDLEQSLEKRFPAEHSLTDWFLLKASEIENREDILSWVNYLTTINREFPNCGWHKDQGLDYIVRRILKECDNNEYRQFEIFDSERGRLAIYFGPLVVQSAFDKLKARREELVSEQYEKLSEDMDKDPENVRIEDIYPENQGRSTQQFVEKANIQFHQLIREFKEGDKVETLFEKLNNKIELCNGFKTEYAVVNMQQCYEAYWGLWQAAQSSQAKTLDAYFRVMAQIAQIPSRNLRPAMLIKLRQWLSNTVDMVQYLDGYEAFCAEKDDMTEEFKKNLKAMVAEDFNILSHHPFHITFKNDSSISQLFNDCHHYLERLEVCHLENIPAEVLVQFASPKLIENHLLSVQELMDFIQFILLNATTPLPKIPHDKQKEIILAFAALGSFTSRHFEPLMHVSRSIEYREKLWRYVMESSEGNLNEQVKIYEIYENFVGAEMARVYLNRWAKEGAVTNELYLRLMELHQDDPTYSAAIGDSVNNNRYLNETEQLQEEQINFDLSREEILKTWDKNEDETIFTEEINQFNLAIEAQQEQALINQTGTDIPYVLNNANSNISLPHNKKTNVKKKKNRKKPILRISILAIIAIIIGGLLKKILGF